MYFSNINNPELKQFHKVIPYNFNMSLTDALSSDLFYIETVIPNSIYRIYLLFYCDKITSSNVNDVILENKCIICNKTSEETYFNFVSNDNDKFILNQKTGYYSFEDTLSDEDYNAIVQLLRANNSFEENIQINNSIVNGDYGTYIFNLKSTTIVDNGVSITNETLSSIGTVKLMSPTFKNSSYQLKLTVYSLSDVNVCNESNDDNIEKTELIIDLVEGSEVNIPFNTLDLNCIVGFNAVVNIAHDLPVITYSQDIILTSDKSQCVIGDTLNLNALYLEDDSPLENEVITFKNGTEILGTGTTDSNGIANFQYTILNDSTLNIVAINSAGKIISNNIEIDVSNKLSTISLEVSKSLVNVGDVVVISGYLLSGSEPLSNYEVKILNGDELFVNRTTDANGRYYINLSVGNVLDYDLKAVFDGDSTYSSSQSQYVHVRSAKLAVSFQAIRWGITEYAFITGKMISSDGNLLTNAPISIYWKGSSYEDVSETRTATDGTFAGRRLSNGQIEYIVVVFEGDETHQPVTAVWG